MGTRAGSFNLSGGIVYYKLVTRLVPCARHTGPDFPGVPKSGRNAPCRVGPMAWGLHGMASPCAMLHAHSSRGVTFIPLATGRARAAYANAHDKHSHCESLSFQLTMRRSRNGASAVNIH